MAVFIMALGCVIIPVAIAFLAFIIIKMIRKAYDFSEKLDEYAEKKTKLPLFLEVIYILTKKDTESEKQYFGIYLTVIAVIICICLLVWWVSLCIPYI